MLQREEKKNIVALPVWVVLFCSLIGFLPTDSGFAATVVDDDYPGVHRNAAGEAVIEELEFKEAKLQDAIRVISELTGVNIVATAAAGQEDITLFVRNLTVAEIIDSVCRVSGLWFRFNPGSRVYIVMTAEEYQQDIVVFRNEPTRIFQLKYLNVSLVAKTIADLFGDRVELMGKGDRYLGDDFIIDAIDDEDIKEDVDDGKNTSSSRSVRNYGDRIIVQSRSRKSSEIEGAIGLTSRQIALLERDQQGMQRVSEQELEKVSQRAEASIYVTINRMHNMLFVRTSDQNAMNEIARIIKDSDRQVPEVLLEMKVLEVRLNDQFKSAFDIANLSGTTQNGPADGQQANPLDGKANTAASSILGLGNNVIQTGSAMVFQSLSDNLRLRLQLLQKNENINTLATPMLLAANNHPARLFIGEENILTTGFTIRDVGTSSGGVSYFNQTPIPKTEKRQIGNRLTILPSINADNSVVMRVIHENSSLKVDGGKIPVLVGGTVKNVFVDTVNSSTLEGTVLIQDGMTVAVGGMMRTTRTTVEDKVPVLGDIPGLGFFFRSENDMDLKTELILLITPHVLTTPSDGEQVSRRRLADSTSYPRYIDGYMNQLMRERAQTKVNENQVVDLRGEDHAAKINVHPLKVAAEKEAPVSAGVKERYTELIKTAVVQIRKPLALRTPTGNIRPRPLAFVGPVRLFSWGQVMTTPMAAWTDGFLHVTAMKLENRGQNAQQLRLTALHGKWQAATLENDTLAPAGQQGDATWLYLVSSRPFEENLPGGK